MGQFGVKHHFYTLVAAILALCTLHQTVHAQTWHRADTRSFIIYSDGDSGKLEDFAEKIEKFDALFMLYFGLDAPPPPNKLTIYLLKDQEAVAQYARRPLVAGFYQTSNDGSFAVSNRERKHRETALSGETVLFHEYVHHAMARYFTFGYPPWYREGFAEFFATTEIARDGDWELGKPANYRVAGLRRGAIPLDSVLFGDLGSMNGEQVNSYYGRSWLLVHLTVFNPERRAHLVNYLSLLGSGLEPREAFAETFGDVAQLEAEMNAWLRGALPSLKSQSPIAMQGDIAIRTLDPVASGLVPLTIKRRTGRGLEQTVADLRAYAAAHPGRADVLAQLALAEFRLAERGDAPDFAAARSATEGALAVEPEHARMLLMQAQIMLEDLAQADETTPDQWDDVRRILARSFASDPNIPLTRVVNYRSLVEQGQRPPVEVINSLGDAVMLAPEAHDIRVQYAWALANEGAFDDAIRLVKFLASDPHQGGIGRDVLRQLEDYRDRRLGR